MIGIVIPTYREAESIGAQITELKRRMVTEGCELLVVDATRCEKTREICESHGAQFITSQKGRAVQMNTGARATKAHILYFLHADSVPPYGFDSAILQTVKKGHQAGCFYMGFDSDHPVLTISGWFTRFKSDWCRGGDQSLFITKDLFRKIGGFDESFIILEDCEIIPRIKKQTEFEVIQQKLVTSARRYRENGVVRLQVLFGMIHLGYRLGLSQQALLKFYKKHIT